MHVHLPKPLHGWRAFAGEVGIIVLGVLIALGFEQLAGEWRWRQQVGTTRQAIDNELATAAEQSAGRLSIEDCLRDRIGELAARLNSSNGRWTADPLRPMGGPVQPTPHWDNRSFHRVYSVPLTGWSQDAWDAAKSGGVLDHMSHDEVASYSDIYGEIAGLRDFQNQELMLESNISFLSTDQQLDNRSRLDALGKLGQLDSLNAVNAGLSSLIVDQVQGLHLHVDRARFARDLQATIAGQRQYFGPCVKDVQIRF
jgi:hypothetical protein